MNLTDRLQCAVPADWVHDFSQCLFEWQGLEGGVLALLAAGLGVYFLRRQIEQQDRLHDATRRSRFAVARAKTPLAAVEIANHARFYMLALEQLAPLVLARASQPFTFECPDFPKEAERILDNLVENTDDSVLIDQVSALYSEHQVMSSRLSRVDRPSELGLCINDYILQPIMMDAIAMNLLAFGRDGQEMHQLKWEEIESRAKALVADKGLRESILAYAADKRNRSIRVPLALRRHSK